MNHTPPGSTDEHNVDILDDITLYYLMY